MTSCHSLDIKQLAPVVAFAGLNVYLDISLPIRIDIHLISILLSHVLYSRDHCLCADVTKCCRGSHSSCHTRAGRADRSYLSNSVHLAFIFHLVLIHFTFANIRTIAVDLMLCELVTTDNYLATAKDHKRCIWQ
jgi:hypothetical protein